MKAFRLAAALLTGAALLSGCVTPAPTPTDSAAIATYDADNPPALAEINFLSAGKRLNGIVYIADGPGPHPSVILLHGYPGNEKNLDLAQALRADGFNVMFFHYRGAWGSEGEFSFTHVIEDVAAAADFLRNNSEDYRVDPDKITLIGHSMGGFAALHAGARNPSIACAAGMAPANFGAVAGVIKSNPDIEKGFSAFSDNMQMLNGWTGKKAIAELKANEDTFDVHAIAPEFAGRHVLLVGANEDTAVRAETTMRPMIAAYEAAADVKTTAVMLPGDHSFSWSRDALIETVTDWADNCR